MSDVYIKSVEGSENTNPDGTDAIEIDDGTNSQWVALNNIFNGAPTTGDIVYFNGTKWARLAASTSGYVLTAAGASTAPAWAASAGGDKYPMEARLTLETGVPFSVTDQASKGTLYLTKNDGDQVAVYTGSAWTTLTLGADLSITLTGLATASRPYDIFAYSNSGTLAIESLVWTSATARATALATQNGVLIKSGDATRRYIGTVYIDASKQASDTTAMQHVFNYYNRKPWTLRATDTTNSWNYTTLTWRAANNSTTVGTARVEICIGWQDVLVNAQVQAAAANASAIYFSPGVGIDSTSANSAQVFGGGANTSAIAYPALAHYRAYTAVGFHYVQRLEISDAVGTTTWIGDGGVTNFQTGMMVDVVK